VVLVLAKTPSAIWLYIVLLGLGEGGWAPILAMLTSSYFGLKNYGALAGFINMSTITVASIAPFILGLFYDRTSTYVPMLIILIGICTIAGLMVALIRKPVVTRITNA